MKLIISKTLQSLSAKPSVKSLYDIKEHKDAVAARGEKFFTALVEKISKFATVSSRIRKPIDLGRKQVSATCNLKIKVGTVSGVVYVTLFDTRKAVGASTNRVTTRLIIDRKGVDKNVSGREGKNTPAALAAALKEAFAVLSEKADVKPGSSTPINKSGPEAKPWLAAFRKAGLNPKAHDTYNPRTRTYGLNVQATLENVMLLADIRDMTLTLYFNHVGLRKQHKTVKVRSVDSISVSLEKLLQPAAEYNKAVKKLPKD